MDLRRINPVQAGLRLTIAPENPGNDMAPPRYYVLHDQKVRSIVDGSSGQIVDDEPMSLMPGETCYQREARMRHQDQRCANLNREDYELRWQLREPREAFAARTGQVAS